MKAKKQKKCVQEQVPQMPVQEALPVQEPKTWVVNCPKCGAALSLKEGGYAYMCPVCSSLLRMKTGARLVKNLDEGKNNLYVTLTENAVKYLTGRDANAPKYLGNLEYALAQNVVNGYSSQELFVIDADENGISVKKS